MAKTQVKRTTTPVSEAVWAKVNTQTDVFDGKEIGYIIHLKMDKANTDRMIKVVTQEFEAGKAQEEYAGKKWSTEPNLPYKEDKDGNILFKFSTKHTFTDKEGNVQKKVVPLFDSLNRPIEGTATLPIGNGSQVKISFTPNVYWINNKNNGIKLFLNTIQVLELKEYAGMSNGSAFGFANEDNDDDPFAD